MLINIEHKRIQPKSIMQDDIVEYFAKDYMYLGCIKYIRDVRLFSRIIEINTIGQKRTVS